MSASSGKSVSMKKHLSDHLLLYNLLSMVAGVALGLGDRGYRLHTLGLRLPCDRLLPRLGCQHFGVPVPHVGEHRSGLGTTLILKVATGESIERRYGADGFNRTKPYFATITLTFLYIPLFSISASKGKSDREKLYVHPADVSFCYPPLRDQFFANPNHQKEVVDLEYSHHQAVTFTTVSKNVALTIAILVTVFGKEEQYLTAFPAIMPLFQVLYLKLGDKVKELLEHREIGEEAKTG